MTTGQGVADHGDGNPNSGMGCEGFSPGLSKRTFCSA